MMRLLIEISSYSSINSTYATKYAKNSASLIALLTLKRYI